MNVLTQIKATARASELEAQAGIGPAASWHAAFRHSAYVFAGGLPSNLTEGDILAVFSQYGEIVDVHLCRDKATGLSRGFAFLAYDDQRSTDLAVDNLGGATVGGRTIRVEHVDDYRVKLAEVEGGEGAVPPVVPEQPRRPSDRAEMEAAAAAGGATVVGGREAGEGPAGGGEPWEGGGSLAALLRGAGPAAGPAARPPPAPPAEAEADRAARKAAKKERKAAKKEKKGRRRERSRSASPRPGGRSGRWRSRSRSGSPARRR